MARAPTQRESVSDARSGDPPEAGELLARAVEEVARLLSADGAMVYLVDPDENALRFAFDAGIRDPEAAELIRGLSLRIGVGIFGEAVARGVVVVTGDYRTDDRFEHSPVADRIAELSGIRSMAAAPLVAGGEVLGALGAYTTRADDFGEPQVGLLRALADHAATAIANRRLIERLAQSEADLARRVEAQRTLGEMATQLTSLRDPWAVLEHALRAAVRLLGGDGGQIGTVAPDGAGRLRWSEGHSLVHDTLTAFTKEDQTPVEHGVSGRALRERRPSWTDDYLADRSFSHDAPSDRVARELGIRAVIAAPLLGESGPIGAIGVYAERPAAFDAEDAELVGLLGDQVAIVLTNARLNAAAEISAAQLAGRIEAERRLTEELRAGVEAQRALAEIASEIASLRDPSNVLQRAVADAARLLGADRAQINLVRDGADVLDPPVAAAPAPPSADDVPVPIGSGIAGLAARECRVCWTGDYLADPTFPHDQGDVRIREQGIRSMMAAPMREADRLIGTITVQSTRPNAFSGSHAELLKLLADQAAIALTNARLYAELGASESRYRHLVDQSPDIVWSVDAEGRFTFLSDSLETRTGWKPEELLGKPFTVLADRGSIAGAESAWAELVQNPQREQRVRLDLPLANGTVSQAEVALAATLIDGRFAGAHGSVRDISERERLEGDLRRQAAELAASQERAHLARELHDSVTQALFSMGLTLRSLELMLDTDVAAARARVAELRELQKDALAEMRTLIFELRPASLETDGLTQALRTHATAVQRRTALTIVVDTEPVPRLPLPVEEALYRIGQEAIHNIVKHANASRAGVRLARDGERVTLTITDDGAGFEPDDVPRGHLGLLGMRQRLDLVGGELRIESTAGRGTTVEAVVPISAGSFQ